MKSWLPKFVRPVRPGVYEIQFTNSTRTNVYSYWDGSQWNTWSSHPDSARQMRVASKVDFKWCIALEPRLSRTLAKRILNKTQWFDRHEKPSRVGVYERKFEHGNFVYSFWNGEVWLCNKFQPYTCHSKQLASGYQNDLAWRGLDAEDYKLA